MRKMVAGLALVFVTTFAVGVTLPRAEAAPCRYKCVCSVPMKCCTYNGVESCKKTTEFACTQVYPC